MVNVVNVQLGDVSGVGVLGSHNRKLESNAGLLVVNVSPVSGDINWLASQAPSDVSGTPSGFGYTVGV